MESNMAKFKHNKLKNTGMLFEFLLRQVTVDVLNKEKNSVALQIIKKRFNEHTEVGKELALYNLLLKKKFKDDKKADFFLSEILRQRSKLNESSLNREKYNIIKEVNDKYDANSSLLCIITHEEGKICEVFLRIFKFSRPGILRPLPIP